MMKRNMRLIGIALFVLMAAFFVAEQEATAERPSGDSYSSNFKWTVYLETTGTAISYDTTTSTAGGNKIFQFTGLDDYGNVSGYIWAIITAVDSGDAAADIPDTSKDSMIVQIWTAWDASASFAKVIYTDSLWQTGDETYGDTLYFNLQDSLIGDRVYFKFIHSISDTDYSVTRAEAGVHYTATVRMNAKP